MLFDTICTINHYLATMWLHPAWFIPTIHQTRMSKNLLLEDLDTLVFQLLKTEPKQWFWHDLTIENLDFTNSNFDFGFFSTIEKKKPSHIRTYGDGSIPIDTFLVGWTSIYQLFWGSLGTRVLTHPHIRICNSAHSQAKENDSFQVSGSQQGDAPVINGL